MNNYSRQREIILDIIKQSKSHPTAEEVYNQVIDIDSKISKSTVYRNISLLVQKNEIIEIPTTSGMKRYDYIKKPHNHAICKNCGKVFDFEYNFNEKELEKQAKQQTLVDVDIDTIIIYGICNNCKS